MRILIDGDSLRHRWPELAPGKARHSAAARDELLYTLIPATLDDPNRELKHHNRREMGSLESPRSR